ncbi:uncharacterized protein LOC117940105 [Tachysurus ichikawai]
MIVERRRETAIRSLIVYLGEKDEDLFKEHLDDVDNNVMKIGIARGATNFDPASTSIIIKGTEVLQDLDQPNSFTPHNTAPPTPASALSLPPGTNLSTEENVPPPMITAAQVCRELRSLHPSKAAGPDGVSPRLLKVCSLLLRDPLKRIFNLSGKQERVSRLWKTSGIIPTNHTLEGRMTSGQSP